MPPLVELSNPESCQDQYPKWVEVKVGRQVLVRSREEEDRALGRSLSKGNGLQIINDHEYVDEHVEQNPVRLSSRAEMREFAKRKGYHFR